MGKSESSPLTDENPVLHWGKAARLPHNREDEMADMKFKKECITRSVCPYCGSRNTKDEGESLYEANEEDIKLYICGCHDCGKEWRNVFRQIDVIEGDTYPEID